MKKTFLLGIALAMCFAETNEVVAQNAKLLVMENNVKLWTDSDTTKSIVIRQLQKGQTLDPLTIGDEWTNVQTHDGVQGYVETSKIKELISSKITDTSEIEGIYKSLTDESIRLTLQPSAIETGIYYITDDENTWLRTFRDGGLYEGETLEFKADGKQLKSAHKSQTGKNNIVQYSPNNNADNPIFYNKEMKLISLCGTAYVGEEKGNRVYAIIEQPASFPGGEGALLALIAKSLQYPSFCIDNHIQGTVNLQFEVLEDGSVGEVLILSSPHPMLTKEAVRVVKSLPRFISGKKQGRAVKSLFRLPVKFRLQ